MNRSIINQLFFPGKTSFHNSYLGSMIAFILFLSVSGDLLATAFRGRIYSRTKGEGEANVMVLIFETKKAFKTDDDGYFDAEVPAPGEYRFRILRATGMQEIKKSISSDGEVLTIYTDKKTPPKGAIQVEGQKEKTILSRYKVRYDEIKRMPGTLGEALNSLQTLPGIFAPPFFGGGAPGAIVIRGANPNSNTILYDDLPILYAYHFDSINSVIHNDLIKTIDVYTGAYPANYANATGGVIEIESTDTVKKRTGSANLSLLLGQVMFQTPLFDKKGYLAVGGKVGYLDKTLGQTGLIPEGIRLPQYTSSNVKFVYNFDTKHTVSFTSLTASDNFVLNAPNKTNNDPTMDPLAAVAGANVAAGQGFQTIGLRYIWTPGSKFNNRLTLIHYNPFTNTNVKFGSIEANFIARAPYTGVRQDLNWDVADFLRLDFGTEVRRISYNISGFGVALRDPNNLSPNPYKTENPDFVQRDITQKTATNYGNAYSTLHFKFGNLKFEPGVRYDYIHYSKQGVLGPRGLLSYKVDGFLRGTTFFYGAGDYFRYPFFQEAISATSGNPNIKFEKARKYGGGIEQEISEEWSVKGEVFKQEYTDLIVSDPYISEPYGLNPDKSQLLTQPIVANRALNYSNRGTGWSRGFELFLKKMNKPGSKDWFGWVSYTWSQTFRNDNIYWESDEEKKLLLTSNERRLRATYKNSKELIYEYDVTHLLSVVFGWRLSDTYQLGGRWFYRTAFPYTPVTGDDGGAYRNPNNNLTIFNPTYSNNPYSGDYINSKRGNPYQRLDIRLDKFFNYEWGYFNFYFEIINVYMRQNTQGSSFDVTKPFSATNPVPQNDFYLLRNGKTIMPFYNIGMEVRF
ncbi:MAG: TonB-dependent receptor plug domain-containing protein [Leptospiraceae bacterium]|nr:TonB-dependent receptor plug domain-containing protein [Leptospiraceae bacterium]MCP5510920.1 TonB-dependent receptor plug domain-containing protein [Leptospiraceae bacterium]